MDAAAGSQLKELQRQELCKSPHVTLMNYKAQLVPAATARSGPAPGHQEGRQLTGQLRQQRQDVRQHSGGGPERSKWEMTGIETLLHTIGHLQLGAARVPIGIAATRSAAQLASRSTAPLGPPSPRPEVVDQGQQVWQELADVLAHEDDQVGHGAHLQQCGGASARRQG